MPREEGKFRRDVIKSSELEYVRKMKYFYEEQLNHLSRMVGEETEFGVLITDKSLNKIEERLSDFEKNTDPHPRKSRWIRPGIWKYCRDL